MLTSGKKKILPKMFIYPFTRDLNRTNSDPRCSFCQETHVWIVPLRGEKLNYNSCTNLLLRKSQNLLFLVPEVQWASKFTVFVRFTFPLNFSNHAHIWYVTWPQWKTSKNSDWVNRFRNLTIHFAKTRHYLQLVVCVWGKARTWNPRGLRE